MHTAQILQRCLSDALASIHALRRVCLLDAVSAIVASRCLALTDVARSWPGALHLKAPLKRLDRLLSNPQLPVAERALREAMARHLLQGPHPVMVVDWADLKGDGRWVLLRAAVPMGGRTLTVFEQVYPIHQQNTVEAQTRFFRALAEQVGPAHQPIVISDAGFRSDWYALVQAQGWLYLGRVRGNVCVRPPGRAWEPCQALFAQATGQPRYLGAYDLVRGAPWRCVLFQQRRALRGRHTRTRRGQRSADRRHLQAARAAREPWLLAASPALAQRLGPSAIMALYAQRMQIEEGFRDLKCPRFGAGLRYSQTRKAPRLQSLLFLHALATFAAWIAGRLAEQARLNLRAISHPNRSRKTISLLRLGREALRRHWLDDIPHASQLFSLILPTPLPY